MGRCVSLGVENAPFFNKHVWTHGAPTSYCYRDSCAEVAGGTLHNKRCLHMRRQSVADVSDQT